MVPLNCFLGWYINYFFPAKDRGKWNRSQQVDPLFVTTCVGLEILVFVFFGGAEKRSLK